ncbi:hypothetical protein MBLNU457_1626t1 [Dothideomycetes sp. NU457]
MATTPDRKAVPETSMSMIAITEAQKQALVDNLQLEITERARKLRAQSALQAQALRVRLEVRVNRIPQSLRKTNMQDLLDKYSAKTEVPAQKSATVPVTYKETTVSPVMNRGIKRASDALHALDKENEAPEITTLDNPKKRAKTAVPTVAASTAAKEAAKAVTRKPVPAQVLSPKSHNSRTLPTSPIKIASPAKSYMPRPASPAKPLLTGPAPTAKSTRAPSKQVKRPAPVTNVSSQSVQQETQRKPSARHSSDSDSTATTTVMKKTTTTAAKSTKAAPAPAAKKVGGFKGAIASLTGSKRGKKAAEAAPAPVPELAKTTTVGGRTLRKRG